MAVIDARTLTSFISAERERYGFVRFAICDRKYRISRSVLSRAFLGPQSESPHFLDYFSSGLPSHSEKLRHCDGYIDETDEYVFQKSPAVFESVLDFIESRPEFHDSESETSTKNSSRTLNGTTPRRNTGIHLPRGLCPSVFVRELTFWGFDGSSVADCCRRVFVLGVVLPTPRSSIISVRCNELETASNDDSYSIFENITGKRESLKPEEIKEKEDDGTDQFTNVALGNFRRTIWNFFEDPTSSKGAKIFSLLSVGVVLLSVLDMVLASMPELQVQDPREGYLDMVPHPVLDYIEIGCIVWFTSEYFIRLLIAGDKVSFLKVPFNIVDVLSVCPFYLELTLDLTGVNTDNLQNVKGALMMLRILRVLRVARIFKVAKYSSSLQNLGGTFTASMGEFAMILMFIGVVIILFSTTIYFMEKDVKGTQFSSIPGSFWWCLITMTTVGYGDMTPATFAGKIVASVTSVSGVICLAFPITLIIDNFGKSREAKAEADQIEEDRIADEAEKRGQEMDSNV